MSYPGEEDNFCSLHHRLANSQANHILSFDAELCFAFLLYIVFAFAFSLHEDKVAAVQAATADATPPVFTSPAQSSGMQFSCFKPISTDEVVVAVRRLSDKASAADPLPVNLLKQVVTELAPYLTELFNRSLSLGHFPGMYKAAYITPLLKKPSLDATVVKSYRPISNLSVLSKLNATYRLPEIF